MGIGMSIKKIPKKIQCLVKKKKKKKRKSKKEGGGDGGVAEETACIFWVVVDNLGAGTV